MLLVAVWWEHGAYAQLMKIAAVAVSGDVVVAVADAAATFRLKMSSHKC